MVIFPVAFRAENADTVSVEKAPARFTHRPWWFFDSSSMVAPPRPRGTSCGALVYLGKARHAVTAA